MKKIHQKKNTEKHAAKRKMAVLMAAAMALQLNFSFSSLADVNDGGYGYYDDYDNHVSSEAKLKKVTRTYDDGTAYTAEYRYDDQGNVISVKEKEPDGSTTATSQTYQGDTLVSKTVHEKDTGRKTETTSTTDYYEDGNRSHTLDTYQYSDGTSESQEVWYLDDYGDKALKRVSISVDGTVAQTDKTYDDQNRLLTSVTASSDGGTSQSECQYNESGDVSHYQFYQYDPYTQVKTTILMRMEGKDMLQDIYTVKTMEQADGESSKSESWLRVGDHQPIKTVETAPDGTQTTENYTYNANGGETLYTKTDGDKTLERRETYYTKTGTEVVSSDSQGNTTHQTNSRDPKTGDSAVETTAKKADGSYSYTKYAVGSDQITYIFNDKPADGSETYIEKTYKEDGSGTTVSKDKSADGTETTTEETDQSDGSSTKREKTADGVITVTDYDADDEPVGRHITMPDGITGETTWTKQEDGRVKNETTRYSDGTEVSIDYEYDASGDIIRQTETRRNGVTVVAAKQTDGAENTIAWNITFNNGCQLQTSAEMPDDETVQMVITYSMGEVYQDIINLNMEEGLNLKTVYRDGRTEEETISGTDENFYDLVEEKMGVISDRCESYIKQAWTVLPPQSGEEEATPSDAG